MITLFSIILQGGASALSDAQHAFDEPHEGSGGSFGIIGFIILIILFLVGLFFWRNITKDK